MASVQSAAYQGRYLKLTVWEDSYSVANNTSTVKWKFESIGGEVNYYSIYNWGVVVNGETIYATQSTEWSTHNFPAAKGSREGTITINHKSDGSADPVSFTLKGKVYYGGTETHSGSINLTKIDRYATFTKHQINSTTEHTITVGWDADVSCDAVQYSLNGGTWTTPASPNYPTYTLSGLSPGTSYSIKSRIKRTDSQLWTESSAITGTTKDCVVRQKISGTWKVCVPYIKVSGTWKKAIPYIKASGSWKEGIN